MVAVVAVVNVVSRPSNHLSYTKLGILGRNHTANSMAMLISFCGFALVPAVTVVAVINVISRHSY